MELKEFSNLEQTRQHRSRSGESWRRPRGDTAETGDRAVSLARGVGRRAGRPAGLESQDSSLSRPQLARQSLGEDPGVGDLTELETPDALRGRQEELREQVLHCQAQIRRMERACPRWSSGFCVTRPSLS